MATSGTTAFDMDFTEIAEEAWERAGREMRSGYDLRTARRSMNLMTIEWQNRGINLWTIDEGTVTLTKGTSQYDLPADTIDLLEQVIRTDSGNATTQQDLTISRISVSTYASIPNKLTQGRPNQVYIERLRDNPKINVWPVPDKDNEYVFKYYRMRRIQDAGTGVETADMNFRFLPLPSFRAGVPHSYERSRAYAACTYAERHLRRTVYVGCWGRQRQNVRTFRTSRW